MNRLLIPTLSVLALAGGLAALSGPALAISTEPAVKTCAKGKILDKKSGKCVAKKAGVVDDAALAEYAYALAKEERFEESLEMLALATDQMRADVLNIRGYATRKLGRVDEGIGYYRQALAADPENVLVREYLGEALVIKGQVDDAKALLKEIEMRCGTDCEAYAHLAAAIETGGW